MSENLQNCIRELTLISQIKDPRLRKSVLKDFSLSRCLYKSLHEIAINTVNKTVPLSDTQKKELKPHKETLKKLACKTRGKKKRAELVVQSGGFLPILIPTISAIIASIIAANAERKESGNNPV
jgi:hypothetical protein